MTDIKNAIVEIYMHGQLHYVCVSQLHYGDVFYDSDNNMWLADTEPYIESDRWTIGASAIGYKSNIGDKIK